ncbi:MAG: cyclase family protein [Ruthenibacterium sp.]
MRKVLSYPICIDSPGWPGNPTFCYEPFTSIKKGDACNTYTLQLFNHFGSHIDAPRHFVENRLAIDELPFDTFLYESPLLLDVPKSFDEKIQPEDLRPYAQQLARCDLLMIRTGMDKARRNDPENYCNHNPSMSAACARYLQDNFGGTLKAVALDFLSLASPQDPEDGNLSHQYLLGMYHTSAICVIEDINLDALPTHLDKVYAIPLLLHGVDSAPVTMWVEYDLQKGVE